MAFTAKFKGGPLDGDTRPLGDGAPSSIHVQTNKSGTVIWYTGGDEGPGGKEWTAYDKTDVKEQSVTYEVRGEAEDA